MDTQEGTKKSYKQWWFYVGVGLVAFVVSVIGLSGDSDTSVATTEPEQVVETQQETVPVAEAQDAVPVTEASTEDSAKAQSELDEVVALAKQAGVISSYEFSETANIVYVTDMWFKLDVAFKKDVMGKIASLKEAITGYHRFEVRHAQSNEKVGEVTAFSGSIEVYK